MINTKLIIYSKTLTYIHTTNNGIAKHKIKRRHDFKHWSGQQRTKFGQNLSLCVPMAMSYRINTHWKWSDRERQIVKLIKFTTVRGKLRRNWTSSIYVGKWTCIILSLNRTIKIRICVINGYEIQVSIATTIYFNGCV